MRSKILVVDDEPDLTHYVKMALEMTSAYEVRTLNDPERTIAVAREFQPELIILDILMPGMDGGDVANGLSQDAQLNKIPIIFLTAVVTQGDPVSGGTVSGGRLYLPKPVELNTLVKAIQGTLKKTPT